MNYLTIRSLSLIIRSGLIICRSEVGSSNGLIKEGGKSKIKIIWEGQAVGILKDREAIIEMKIVLYLISRQIRVIGLTLKVTESKTQTTNLTYSAQ